MQIVNLALRSGQTIRFQAESAGFKPAVIGADGNVIENGQFHWVPSPDAGFELPFIDVNMIAAMTVQDVVEAEVAVQDVEAS